MAFGGTGFHPNPAAVRGMFFFVKVRTGKELDYAEFGDEAVVAAQVVVVGRHGATA